MHGMLACPPPARRTITPYSADGRSDESAASASASEASHGSATANSETPGSETVAAPLRHEPSATTSAA